MLTAIIVFILSIIIFPILVLALSIVFALSLISRAKKRKRFPEPKPKGTIEILPAEKEFEADNDLEGKLDRLKGRKIGKDKFRDL